MELLQRIQRWYTINCNGDWEHEHVVSITNVDNPGWWVSIDLQDTCLQNAALPMQPTQTRSTTNWVFWHVEDQKFIASGGPENLTEILEYFLDTFLPAHIDPEFTYDIHLPVKGYEDKLWLKAEAKILSESVVEITTIADKSDARSYEWRNDAELNLLNELTDAMVALDTDYEVGNQAQPYVFQSEDNMLRTFLVAPAKS